MKHRTLLATLAGLLLVIGLAATSPWDQLRDSFATLSADMTTVKAEQAALGTKVEGLGGEVAELKVSGQNAAAEIAKLSVRVTALEKPPVPDPIPDPVPEPEPDASLTDRLEYLGRIEFTNRLPEDQASGDRTRQFAYSPGIASRGTQPDTLFVAGHAHGIWVAEVRLPEPSKTAPYPKTEFVQPFANLVRPGIDQPRIAGLLYHDERLYLTFDRHYNVAHAQFPSICWGPPDLSKHVSDGTDLLWVTDAEGKRIDFERVAAPMFVSPWGLAYANQSGKHAAKSDGPAVATWTPTEDGVTGFEQRLFYERGSGVFPDPPNKWNETCRAPHAAVIDGQIVVCGVVGLATGLPELTGQNYFYGGPDAYPVPGVNICKGPASKGYHAPPYEGRLWVFDRDLKLVETINLSSEALLGSNNGCGQSPASIIWDEAERRIYLVCGGSQPVIEVFGVPEGAVFQ